MSECKGSTNIGKIKVAYFVSKYAAYWFKKHIESGNMKGIERMIKRGTVQVISPTASSDSQ